MGRLGGAGISGLAGCFLRRRHNPNLSTAVPWKIWSASKLSPSPNEPTNEPMNEPMGARFAPRLPSALPRLECRAKPVRGPDPLPHYGRRFERLKAYGHYSADLRAAAASERAVATLAFAALSRFIASGTAPTAARRRRERIIPVI